MTPETLEVINRANVNATIAAIISSIILTLLMLWSLQFIFRKVRNKALQSVIVLLSLFLVYFFAHGAAVYAFHFTYRPYFEKAVSSAPGMSFVSPEYGYVPFWIHHNSTANYAGLGAILFILATWLLIKRRTAKAQQTM